MHHALELMLSEDSQLLLSNHLLLAETIGKLLERMGGGKQCWITVKQRKDSICGNHISVITSARGLCGCACLSKVWTQTRRQETAAGWLLLEHIKMSPPLLAINSTFPPWVSLPTSEAQMLHKQSNITVHKQLI